MKRTLFALSAVVLLAAGSGCNRQVVNDDCSTCGPGGGRGLLGHHAQQCAAPGPPTAGVGYPYYTVRGPRDFFCNRPSSTGPY